MSGERWLICEEPERDDPASAFTLLSIEDEAGNLAPDVRWALSRDGTYRAGPFYALPPGSVVLAPEQVAQVRERREIRSREIRAMEDDPDQSYDGDWEYGYREALDFVLALLAAPKEKRASCHKPMRGLYGAETICARPAGHRGACRPIHDEREWNNAEEER